LSPNPFGNVPFGFAGVSAGLTSAGFAVSAGLSPNPFGNVPFGFAGVSAGLTSAGFASDGSDTNWVES
jgi:hypothetical protein